MTCTFIRQTTFSTSTTILSVSKVALLQRFYCMGLAMQKFVFGHMGTAKAQISLPSPTVWSGPLLSFPLSLDTTECLNGEQRPGWDWACVSTYFAHAQRQFFADVAHVMIIQENGTYVMYKHFHSSLSSLFMNFLETMHRHWYLGRVVWDCKLENLVNAQQNIGWCQSFVSIQ